VDQASTLDARSKKMLQYKPLEQPGASRPVEWTQMQTQRQRTTPFGSRQGRIAGGARR
jgi:hypothetical protein